MGFILLGIMLLFAGMAKANPAITMKNDITSKSYEQPKGVVLIDDIHSNDYADGNLDLVYDDLENMGYVPMYASNFSTFEEGLSHAHYLVMTAPYMNISDTDIQAISSWMGNGSKNLLIASRGDFSSISRSSINEILSSVGVEMRTNDDNVYTTDSSARKPWYIETNNFNTDYANLFTGVDTINFFSPSSVVTGSNTIVLVNAEAPAYQSDENPPEPSVIYDNTQDGEGGERIPLAGMEFVNDDRVVLVGTTLWSDFDYGDSSAEDTVFFGNLMEYFTEQTRQHEEIVIDLPDPNPPVIKVDNPRNGGTVKGTVPIRFDIKEPFGLKSVEVWIDDNFMGNASEFDWDTTTYSDGGHTINITAVDNSGNVATKLVNVIVDQNLVPKTRNPVKIMTYNIKESGIFPQWLDVVKEENPDILVLVETGDFDNNNNELMNKYLDELNVYFMDFAKYEGYTQQNIQAPYSGITIFSRFGILDAETISSVTLDSGARKTVALPFLHAQVNVFEQTVHIIGGHLTCCPGEDNEKSREEEQEGIMNFMDGLGNVPIIYLGDMNSNSPMDPGTHDLGTKPIEIVVDPSNPQTAIRHEFKDVYLETNPDKIEPTYIASGLESRIDFIFVNQWFFNRIINSTIGDTPSAREGSDHVPVDVFLDMKNLTKPAEISHTFSTQTPEPSSSEFIESSAVTPSPIELTFMFTAIAINLIINGRKKKYLAKTEK